MIFVLGVILAITGCRISRSGYKSAPYTIVRSDGDFELRDYPSLNLVETTMKDGGREEASTGCSASSPEGTMLDKKLP